MYGFVAEALATLKRCKVVPRFAAGIAAMSFVFVARCFDLHCCYARAIDINVARSHGGLVGSLAILVVFIT